MASYISTHLFPISLLAVVVLLFVFLPTLARLGRQREDVGIQVPILRIVLALFAVLIAADLVAHEVLTRQYDRLLLRSTLSLVALVLSTIAFNLAMRFFDQRYGTTRRIDGSTVLVPSYHSRMAGVIFIGILVVLTGYALIKIWEMDSLLEKTGFIGVVAAIIALTSAVWLPDIFHGIVLLGSNMAEEGDTVVLPGEDRVFIIHRLTPFYGVLLDVDNNHRVMLTNTELSRLRLENLSKRASVEGLRQSIEIKIGYPALTETESRISSLFNRIDQAVSTASDRAASAKAVHINQNLPFEWSMIEAGCPSSGILGQMAA